MSEPLSTASPTGDVGTTVSLEAILDRVALPVWVVDHDGLVVLANPAALATLGYEHLSELRGRHGHNTMHYKHPDGSPYPADDCEVLEPAGTGVPVHSDDDWFIRRDGTMFPVSFTAVPIDLDTGRGVVVTFLDLTAQRAAERGLRERDAILARVAQPVWVVDHEGYFRYANPAALAALGYDDPAELVGRPGHETVHHKYPTAGRFQPRTARSHMPGSEATASRSTSHGSYARTGRSCPSRTRRRPSTCRTGVARSPRSPTSRPSSRRNRPRAIVTSPRRAPRSWPSRAAGSSRPPTPPGAASPATFTTARSSSSSAPS